MSILLIAALVFFSFMAGVVVETRLYKAGKRKRDAAQRELDASINRLKRFIDDFNKHESPPFPRIK
ncbi:MAG: hypothetical protein PHE17_18020 [Thiothrix sp.]|uniref:hypothetical protein n=1 Tax=Thiothrix sp. TaxID=1032 RepID=UPI002639F2A2|nr:hypothetical protein [Thiothrix sp.]MDD5394918.1 hypothetical protein [Thiothrix sp.]